MQIYLSKVADMSDTRKTRYVAFISLTVLIIFAAVGARAILSQGRGAAAPAPIDLQKVQDQDAMTFADFHPIPGHNWADPSLKPEREFHMALVAVDFSDQPFVITLPKHSDPFGNPQIDPIKREQVPQFYADFFLKPSAINHGHTINGYWMEQSRGKFGITQLDAYGPYRMPKPLWHYGLNEYGQNSSTPDGSRATGRLEQDCDALWAADKGDLKSKYNAILRIYAGYDETGVWQEFGEMKFNSKEDIPPEWGNPNKDMPRWIPTRYVEWTSWLAGAQQWGLSSIRQGESSGTITHELGHFAFSIPDLNNNPYVKPYRRVAAGPWDMMDRGSFNGPGGPHRRWVVPATEGAAMPAPLMLRNRLENKFITTAQLVQLNREGLAKSGLAVANVTARSSDPLPGSFAGITVALDGKGDLTPPDDPATNPLSAGIPNYNFYSVEVIQRIGYDSFCPDSGVLLAKNKTNSRGNNGGPNAFQSFIWVIDAHPEDINMVDFVKSNGTKVMRTIADYRQLNDALFHAGLNSGSQYEWEDTPNRLHFYVINIAKDANGILNYTLAVRSLDGAGPQARGVTLAPTKSPAAGAACAFTLTNTGKAAPVDASLHPQDATPFLNYDVYRVSVSMEGKGWSAYLQNALTAVRFGGSMVIPVFATHEPGSAATAQVTLLAKSESDPTKTATAVIQVK